MVAVDFIIVRSLWCVEDFPNRCTLLPILVSILRLSSLGYLGIILHLVQLIRLLLQVK